MKAWRFGIGTAGVLLALYGVYRLLTEIPTPALVGLLGWLLAAVIIHDGVLSPLILAIGWITSRTVPARARRYLQAALITGALITVIAVPLIYRRGSQPKSKAILQQDYATHLVLLLAAVAGCSLLAYALHLARDIRQRADRPAHERSGDAAPGS